MMVPAKYLAARNALAAATAVDEVKDIRDKAQAMEAYAYQAKDPDLVAFSTEMKRRATRRLGELMAEVRAADELAKPTGSNQHRVKTKPEAKTLASQGIDKNLADSARKFAAMPQEKFEAETEKASMIAVAAVLGDKAVVKEARAEQNKDKAEKRAAREQALAAKIVALPKKKYGVILADPEWRFEVYSRDTGMDRAADNHYPTSATEIIAARPVADIAADDCVLFLWATSAMLPDALQVMAAWGFTYKTHCIWLKDRMGTGYWFRNNHELLLVGARGHVPAPAMGSQPRSAIEAPVGAHSVKPDRFMEIIEAFFPSLPKIELNARRPREGWDAWGLDAGKFDGPAA